MSKELEALDRIIDNYAVGIDNEFHELVYTIKHYINQQPQLSDDVEEAIRCVFEWADEGMEIYSNKGDLPKHKETIKKHIQAQASEIERLKEQKINDDIDFAKLEVLYEIQAKLARSHCKKLNSIRYLNRKYSVKVDNLSEWEIGHSMLGDYISKLEQILNDELPFTDLPKDYSDGEVEE